MLDKCYSFEKVGGPLAHMSPSRVLLEVDPIAHRCGVNDWADGEPWTEVDGEYYEDSAIEEARESFIDELQDELAELEDELTDVEAEEVDEINETERQRLKSAIDALEAFIAECESYEF